MRAALYCRVSTEKQVKEGDSIAAQLEALHKYANERKYQIIGTFVDDGISGTKNDRDEFQRMIDLVQQDAVDIICVTKMDRLHRSLRNFLNMQDILDQHRCNWIAIWEPMYDTTTPQGRMIINTMMNLAQFEAENTGQRIRQVQAYKVQKREVISGNTSPGYSIVDKHLVPNDDAETVRQAFDLYDRTNSIAAVVREFEGTCIPKSANGVRQLLTRRIYIGEAHGMTDFCEPIVDRSVFDRVQIALGRNIKSNQKRIYLFSGLLRCSECGAVMAGLTRKRERRNPAALYRCSKHYQRYAPKCPNTKVVSESVLERDLLAKLPNLVVERIETHKKQMKPVHNYKKKKATLMKKVDRLKDLYLAEELTLDEYKADKAELLEQIDALEPVTLPEPPEAVFALQGINILEIYNTLTREEQRAFWRGIIKEIRFSKDREFFIDFL